ncbi:MAG: DUF692 domain-containing protein [Myxococcales bacterium]|nr:DUF692 domain-containing protein [Myxococcales bacterium]
MLGFGVGLRAVHYPDILERIANRTLCVDWFEVLTENYMVDGGRPLRVLDDVRASVPVVLHGVSLNLGSTDPLDDAYLEALVRLADRVEPAWISDHLCWTGVGGTQLHDLLPLPYAADVVVHLADRIRRVQDRLKRRIAVENVSSYLSFEADEMSEVEFLVAVAERADCGILLDVNNVFVSAHNHEFDAAAYVDAVPAQRVFQIHLAGHSEQGPLLIDTHDHPVRDEVWALYERALRRIGSVSTLVEWDDRIPAYDRLEEEAQRARLAAETTKPSAAEGSRVVAR